MQADLEACLATASTIACEAGDLARRLFTGRKPGTFSLKGHQDFLTEADGEVERLIAGRLAQAFPGDAFFGEEGGGEFRRRPGWSTRSTAPRTSRAAFRTSASRSRSSRTAA